MDSEGNKPKLSEAPATLEQFLNGPRAPRTVTAELPLPKMIKIAVERIYTRLEDKARIKRGKLLVENLLAARSVALQDPAKRTVDSTVRSIEELKAQRDKDLYEKLAFREWLDGLPEDIKAKYMGIGFFLKPLVESLEKETDIPNVIEQLDELAYFSDQYLVENSEHSELLAKYPKLLIKFIASIKNFHIKTRELDAKFDPSKFWAYLNIRVSGLKKMLPEITDEKERKLAEKVFDNIAQINKGDINEAVHKIHSELSALAVFNLPLHAKSQSKYVETVKNPSELVKKWKNALATIKEIEGNPEFKARGIESIVEEMKVFTDNFTLLSESLSRPYIDRISRDTERELRDMLKSVLKHANNILVLINSISSVNGEEGSKARFDKKVLPIYREIFERFKQLYRKLIKTSDLFAKSNLNIDALKAGASAKGFDLDDSLNFEEKSMTKQSARNVKLNFATLDTGEIELGVELLEIEDALPGKVSDFLDESIMTTQGAVGNIERFISLAQREDRYDDDLGPEIEKANDVFKKSLRRLIIAIAKIFDERASMTIVFPELHEEVNKIKALRRKLVELTDDLNAGMRQFPMLLKKLNAGDTRNIAKVLGLYEKLHEIMTRHDEINGMFLEDDAIKWEQMKAELLEVINNPEKQSKQEIRDLGLKVSDFLTSVDTLPRDVNNREYIIIYDRERIVRAKQTIETARGLIEVEAHQSKEDILSLLITASLELTRVRDRNEREVDILLMHLDNLIENIEGLDYEDFELLGSQFINLETQISKLIVILGI